MPLWKKAKAADGDLLAAKSEITRISRELDATLKKAKATDGDLLAAKSEIARTSRERDAALSKAKTLDADLLTAKVELAMLSEELADFRSGLAGSRILQCKCGSAGYS